MLRTWNEDVFVWGADELQGALGEEREILVDCVAGDILVRAVIQGNQDVQED